MSEDAWKRRFDRERKVRKEAEALLEAKALELFQANVKLKEEMEKRSEQERMLIQQSKMSAMGEMIGSIAHQWRQPLNVVSLLIADMLEAYEYGDLDEGYLKDVQKDIMENIKFMSDTIDDFRNFFQISNQKVLFSIKEVIDEVLRLYFHENKDLNIDIKMEEITLEELTILGLKNEFKQVVLNLLNNSKDILLERNITDKWIFIEFSQSEDSINITFEDSGGGIPTEIIDKIFQPYFTTKHEDRGTGIGLYMSKTIIEDNMSGTISVSNTDIGAKFIISFPK
jgi:signal transduction histidine kinase